MHAELKALLYTAEDHYLSEDEMGGFNKQIKTLETRLETYEVLRDREIELFQPIADQLVREFASEDEKVLERSLKQWIGVLRYCGMAMLLNNPNYLQHRLLEWLTPVLTTRHTQAIEQSLYQLLKVQLQNSLSPGQMKLLQPYLEQIKTTLLAEKAVAS